MYVTLRRLEEKGYVRRDPNRPRAIEVTTSPGRWAVPEGMFSVLGGGFNYKFVQELPENLNEWVQAWSEFKSA